MENQTPLGILSSPSDLLGTSHEDLLTLFTELQATYLAHKKASTVSEEVFIHTYESLRYRTIEARMQRFAMNISLGRKRTAEILESIEVEIDEAYIRTARATSDVEEIPHITELQDRVAEEGGPAPG